MSNDDYGDEAELEIIIAKGQQEAEDFGGYNGPFWRGRPTPAKWLNPPHPVDPLEVLGLSRLRGSNE